MMPKQPTPQGASAYAYQSTRTVMEHICSTKTYRDTHWQIVHAHTHLVQLRPVQLLGLGVVRPGLACNKLLPPVAGRSRMARQQLQAGRSLGPGALNNKPYRVVRGGAGATGRTQGLIRLGRV